MRYIGGIDIGGTKCAVSIGIIHENSVEILEKTKIDTPDTPEKAIDVMIRLLKDLVQKHPNCPIEAIGISCGGPLDSEKGLILAPPNLPNWIEVDIVTPFQESFNVPTAVQNDANACALAEWLWGAGKGYKNIIFLTFGTGMGAGLILNGQLYTGTNDMAGEVGHIRLEQSGPIGYHKKGSFEGFCSGGGIAVMGRERVAEHLNQGLQTLIISEGMDTNLITATDIGIAAEQGDELALSIFKESGEKLGKAISILIDILNPQLIVIGSIFLRQEKLLRTSMEKEIEKEALFYNRKVCKVVAAGLGEMIGDYAAYSVGINKLMEANKYN